ncbi:PQQ-binding-like beta-propeller repeat protein [Candidatus Micrarchaeota archaeon]|nr:PQQ-binding-like beta-propeller repeat protein [Candidatus Micrarchaeota archaeon]
MRHALLLLLVLAVSNASLVWEFTSDGAVSSKPVIYQGAVAVASDDGIVYGLDPATGVRRWQTAVGKRPNELISADNAIYLSTSSGKVVKLGANGAKQWETNLNVSAYNVSRIYGIAVNARELFVTANSGVFIMEKDGTVRSKIAAFNDSVLSPPAAGADYVIYGSGGQLIRQSETGQTPWKAQLDEGSFWLSRPTIEGTVVYAGALDDKMHAFFTATGGDVWAVRTRNWVVGTPLVQAGVVYFGSNDGSIYAVDSGDGFVRWAARTQLAVQTQPESGLMGGRTVVFAGGTDKSIYAIETETGEIVWKGSSTASVGSPLFYQNKVIFGSDDGKVYAYSTERACSITSPPEGAITGLKELVVTGKHVSEAGGATVLVQVNSGEWMQANTTDDGWIFYINPKAMLAPGLNVISCQVADAGGSESGPAYTSVSINHDSAAPLSDLVLAVSPEPIEGRNFTVYVNDGDDGSTVDRFNISFGDGAAIMSDKNYTTSIASPGEYVITVKKIGFNDATMKINVNASGVNPLYIAAGVLLIIILVWQVWTRFLRQKFAARKK